MKHLCCLFLVVVACACFSDEAVNRPRAPGERDQADVPPGPRAGSGRSQGAATAGTAARPEPAIDLPTADPEAPLILNEVACRGTEFVEVVNRGSQSVDLKRFAIADHARRDDDAVPLSGTLAPGARASFALRALACDGDPAVLFEGDTIVDHVWPPLMPANASFARLPDADGEFALAKPTPGKANSAFIDDAARLFLDLDEAVPSTLPELHITLPADALASLRGVTAESPRPWLKATLTFRDARGEVGPISTGIHLKGQSVFRDIDGKAAFKLDFDRFEDGSHLFGIEKLTLNNFVQDASASHERVYYGLVARQGGAAPRVGYVNVWVNGAPFGVYLALESSDEESFLGRSFASTALLYEGEYGADLYLHHEGEFDEDYGEDPSRAALARVINTFNDASDSSLTSDTDEVIDWERVIPQMATDLFCGHFDSYTANRNNFTFHIDDDGRLALISGGADQAFIQSVERDVDGGQLLARCLKNTACSRALDDALAKVAKDAGDFLARGGADRLRADAARLSAAFADDPRTEWDQRSLGQLVDETLTFIERATRTY